MYNTIKLRRGLELHLEGAVDSGAVEARCPAVVAMVPDDFPGFTPRVVVRPGDKVTAGMALMTDKANPSVAVVSPVAGVVDAVVRGERRKVMRVTVVPSAGSEAFRTPVVDLKNPEEVRSAIMGAGLWVMMRQLPYDVVPDAAAEPRDIFVTAFDSAPLATPLADRVKGKTQALRRGLDALSVLTKGHVYIGVDSQEAVGTVFGAEPLPERVVATVFDGPSPAGLPEVQAANIKPVNKGETVWLLDVVTLSRIGEAVAGEPVDWTAMVALAGSEVTTPQMISTVTGADIPSIVSGLVKQDGRHHRVISGNVLTGVNVGEDGFLRYPYRQVTVIPEGDDVDEFMGWASLSPKKMSESRSFVSRLLGRKRFAPDARLNGGRRAMIMSEQYDKRVPMDIMPEYLVKAILSRDIDKMESLGIYEVTPAVFAGAEYADPSKLELQKIVREGLDYLRKELS